MEIETGTGRERYQWSRGREKGKGMEEAGEIVIDGGRLGEAEGRCLAFLSAVALAMTLWRLCCYIYPAAV